MNAFIIGIIVAFALIAHHPSKTVETLWLKTSAQVIGEKGSVQLTCHVPRNADNRWVELGIEGYRASTIPLEGLNSIATHQILFLHVPCGIGAAYCNVGGIEGAKVQSTKLTILVSGCSE